VRAATVMLAVICGAAAPGSSSNPVGRALPLAAPPLPLDEQGMPMRSLSDDELFRLLVGMSAGNGGAAMLLASCHAAGAPYGSEAWRISIMRRP
jgi:hypothetical protein